MPIYAESKNPMQTPETELFEPYLLPNNIDSIQNNTENNQKEEIEIRDAEDPFEARTMPEPPEIDAEMVNSYNNNYSTFHEEVNNEASENNSEFDTSTNAQEILSTNEYDPVTFDSPFASINNQNEDVILNQGALSLEYPLISLSGKNGFDFNLSLRYDSKSAVLNSPLYSYPQSRYTSSLFKNSSQTNYFSPGWTLSMPHIQKFDANELYSSNAESKIILEDGRIYKNNEKFKTKDISYVSDSSSQREYLYYKDGKTEVFDMQTGNLLSKTDRFGNEISFEYTPIEIYRTNYTSYAGNPSIYKRTIQTLSKIKDSLKREIIVTPTIEKDPLGQSVTQVTFTLNNQVLAVIKYKLINSMFGPITVIDELNTYIYGPINPSASDTTKLVYKFTHDELIAASTANDYITMGAASYISLSSVSYPTGSISRYEYGAQNTHTAQ